VQNCTPSATGQAVITKSVVNSGVVHTGDTVEWDIIVTASGGNIQNFTITDTLIENLSYVSWTNLTPSLIPTSAIQFTQNGQDLGWQVNATLNSGNQLKIRLKTTVVILPPSQLTNVACVSILPSQKQDCDNAEIEIRNPDLWLHKRFIDGTTTGKSYHSGDEVGYRIDFGNSGAAVATLVELRDLLPKNLQYLSSYFFISTPTHTEGNYIS